MHRFLAFLILSINIIFFLILNQEESIPLFILINIIVFFIKCGHISSTLVYNLIALFGSFYLYVYDYNYQAFHAPFGDDSFFYNESLIISQSQSIIDIYRPYETILSIIIYFLNFLGVESFFNVLLINWLIPTMLIVTVAKYVKIKFNYFINYRHLFLFTMFNYIVLDIFVHLYRDSLIYLLTFIFLILYENFKTKKRIVLLLGLISLSLLILFIRGGNLILLLFYVFFDFYFYRLEKIKKLKKKTVFKLVLFMTMLLFGIGALFQEVLISSISRYGNHSSSSSIMELSSTRQESFFNQIEEQQNTVFIYNLGVIGYPLRIVSQFYSPITFKTLNNEDFRVSTKTNIFYLSNYKDFTAIFYGISIFLWIYTLPRLIVGLYRSYNIKMYQPYFIWFIVSLIMVAFISLQPRHRMMFMMLYPIFFTIYSLTPLNRSEKKIFKYSSIFAFCTVTASFIYFLYNLI